VIGSTTGDRDRISIHRSAMESALGRWCWGGGDILHVGQPGRDSDSANSRPGGTGVGRGERLPAWPDRGSGLEDLSIESGQDTSATKGGHEGPVSRLSWPSGSQASASTTAMAAASSWPEQLDFEAGRSGI